MPVPDVIPPAPPLTELAGAALEDHKHRLNLWLTHYIFGWTWCQWTEAGEDKARAEDPARPSLLGVRFLAEPRWAEKMQADGMFAACTANLPIAPGADRSVVPIAFSDGLALQALEVACANGGVWQLSRDLVGFYRVMLSRSTLAPIHKAEASELALAIAEALGRSYGVHA